MGLRSKNKGGAGHNQQRVWNRPHGEGPGWSAANRLSTTSDAEGLRVTLPRCGARHDNTPT